MYSDSLFYRLTFITTWITRLFYLNILWFVFSILGLGIIGVFPATSATFSVVRQCLIKHEDIPLFKTFFYYYKKDFIKINGLGGILSIIAVIIYLDTKFIQSFASSNFITSTLELLLIMIAILFVLTMSYVFPVFVHYQLNIVQIMKRAILLSISNPLQSFIIVGSFIIIWITTAQFPGLFLLLTISTSTLIIMKVTLKIFQKLS